MLPPLFFLPSGCSETPWKCNPVFQVLQPHCQLPDSNTHPQATAKWFPPLMNSHILNLSHSCCKGPQIWNFVWRSTCLLVFIRFTIMAYKAPLQWCGSYFFSIISNHYLYPSVFSPIESLSYLKLFTLICVKGLLTFKCFPLHDITHAHPFSKLAPLRLKGWATGNHFLSFSTRISFICIYGITCLTQQ